VKLSKVVCVLHARIRPLASTCANCGAFERGVFSEYSGFYSSAPRPYRAFNEFGLYPAVALGERLPAVSHPLEAGWEPFIWLYPELVVWLDVLGVATDRTPMASPGRSIGFSGGLVGAAPFPYRSLFLCRFLSRHGADGCLYLVDGLNALVEIDDGE